MRLLGTSIFLTVFAGLGFIVHAQDAPMPTNNFKQLVGDEIMAAYVNKTMEGIYSSYADEIRANLRPVTFTETHHDNATSTYNHRGDDEFTVTGIYQVRKKHLCYYYNDPPHITGQHCFYVFRTDSCFYHFSADAPVPAKQEDFELWISMAYAKEDAGRCLPDVA